MSTSGGSGGGPSLPVSIANGGTGQTTALAGFDALSPLTTAGDLLVFAASHNARLGATLAGHVPMFDGTNTAMKVLRAQFDAGVTITSKSSGTTMQNASFTLKAPFVVGDAFKLTAYGDYTNASGSSTTPHLILQLGNSDPPGTAALDLAPTVALASAATARHWYCTFDFTVTTVAGAGSGVVESGGFCSWSVNNVEGLAATTAFDMNNNTSTFDTTADLVCALFGITSAGVGPSLAPTFISLTRIPLL